MNEQLEGMIAVHRAEVEAKLAALDWRQAIVARLDRDFFETIVRGLHRETALAARQQRPIAGVLAAIETAMVNAAANCGFNAAGQILANAHPALGRDQRAAVFTRVAHAIERKLLGYGERFLAGGLGNGLDFTQEYDAAGAAVPFDFRKLMRR